MIQTPMFMVLSSWHSHCKSSSGSFDECSTAPGGCWPLQQADQLKPIDLPIGRLVTTFSIAIYYSSHKLILIYHPTEDRRL